MDTHELVTAARLEECGVLKKGTAYKMAKANLIPCRYVGPKRTGIRFNVSEVLEALRRQPAQMETLS
jgi:hypothetical protein